MATQPNLRIGDSERNATAAELSEHYAHGRLTLEEFNQRLDATFAAKTQADLSRITADLPHVRSGGAPLPSARTARGPQRPGALFATFALADRIGSSRIGSGSAGSGSAGSGGTGSGGTGSGRAYGQRLPSAAFATLLTLVAIFVSWLIVYYTSMADMRFPWPGKLGLLFAAFTLIRGLLRRIFRGARRR